MIRPRFFISSVASLVLAFVLLMAGDGSSAFAQSAGAFSRVGFGARGIAMGNALSADVLGAGNPYYNPALAPFSNRQNLSVSVSALSFDRSLQFLQFASPLEQNAGIAAGLIHASVDRIDGRDNSGFHTQDLKIDEYAGFLAFGLMPSESISFGIGIQFFRSDLFESVRPAVAVGIDLGITVRVGDGMYAALVLDDLMAKYKWKGVAAGSSGNGVTDPFPRRIRLGLMTTRLLDGLLATVEYESRSRTVDVSTRNVSILGGEPIERTEVRKIVLREDRLRFGAEYRLIPQFLVRAGMEQLGSEPLGGVRPAAGFMLEQEVGAMIARFEYAFSLESQASGTMHIFTLRLYL